MRLVRPSVHPFQRVSFKGRRGFVQKSDPGESVCEGSGDADALLKEVPCPFFSLCIQS